MSDIIAFSHKYNLQVIKIEDIQNISLFIIGCFSLFSYLYYNLSTLWYDNNDDSGGDFTKPFNMLVPFIGIHAFADFFLTKSYDLKIHHLCILGSAFYNYYHNLSREYRFIFLYPLTKTEISSIFYVLKYWLPKNTNLYNVNTMLFYISFAKFRIYDFYYEIIYNNISFDIVRDVYSSTNYYTTSIMVISCYGLYILNLYWFLIMNKILYKLITKIVNNINTDILCHFLCYCLHWVNLSLSIYIYSYNPNEKYIFDIIGISALCISSYRYHYDIYKRLYYKQIEDYSIPNKDNIILFFDDIIAIHIRSFLVLLTNYYNNEKLFYILLVSSIFHIGSIYDCVINSLHLFIDYDTNKNVFLKRHNIISSIPIICNVFLIYLNSPVEISIPYLLINIMICLLFIVKPFYKLTHVGFHLLLISQTYYMCLSNIKQGV